MCSGSSSARLASSPSASAPPVGLFGLQTTRQVVRSVTAASSPFASQAPVSRSGTGTAVAELVAGAAAKVG